MNNTDHFKHLLEVEKKRLIRELASVGRINPENPKDWEPTPGDTSTLSADRADQNVLADTIEDFEERSAVEVELENRLFEVNNALQKIEEGNYGLCKTCNKPIEEDRLGANPAAKTCKEHINEE